MKIAMLIGAALGVLVACSGTRVEMAAHGSHGKREGQLCGRTALNCVSYKPAGKTAAEFELDLKDVRESSARSSNEVAPPLGQ